MLFDEQKHFWVLDKPGGEAVNDDGSAPGFVSRFQSELGCKAYPAHRLDRDTSGLLLVAKTAEANRALSLAFRDKQVLKLYLAITRTKTGVKPKKKQGSVKGDMEKSRAGSWKLLHSFENPAETYFQSSGLGDRKRLCVVRPVSGKTHQIRVAMRSLSMPILGDLRYGGESADRMYLHATRLRFSLFGNEYSYTSLPKVGEQFLELDQAFLLDSLAALMPE